MQYRLLGNTGLKVSVIGVGCMTFGWRADAEAAYQIVSQSLDNGINVFDTSVSYGRGVSETLLGESFKRCGRRQEALIATKFGLAATADAKPNEVGNSKRTLIAHCELSLRRLHTEWIDLLQIHNFSSEVPLEETLRGLDQLVRDGKIRYFGCCNFSGEQLYQGHSIVDRRNLFSIASHQGRFNLLDRRAELDVMQVAVDHGMGNLAYSPLAEGLLTGKYQQGRAFPAGSRFAVASPANQYEARLTTPVADAVKALAGLAAKYSMELHHFALAWVIAHPGVSCALVGPSTPHQMADINRVLDTRIDTETMGMVDAINPPGRCIFP